MIWKLLSSGIQSFQLAGSKFWHVSFRGTKQVFEYELLVSVTINFLSSWMINFVCSTTNLNPLLKNFECRKGRTTPRVGLHFIRWFVFLSVVVPPSSLVLTVSLEFMSVIVVVLMNFWGNSCSPWASHSMIVLFLYIHLFHFTAWLSKEKKTETFYSPHVQGMTNRWSRTFLKFMLTEIV